LATNHQLATYPLQPARYQLATSRSLPTRYNPLATNSLRIGYALPTRYDPFSYELATNWLQPAHYELATTRSLRIRYDLATTRSATNSLRPARYELATNWLRTTNSPRPAHYDLATTRSTTNSPRPARYEFATHHELATTRSTTTSLQPAHHALTTTSLQPARYEMATHYKLATTSLRIRYDLRTRYSPLATNWPRTTNSLQPARYDLATYYPLTYELAATSLRTRHLAMNWPRPRYGSLRIRHNPPHYHFAANPLRLPRDLAARQVAYDHATQARCKAGRLWPRYGPFTTHFFHWGKHSCPPPSPKIGTHMAPLLLCYHPFLAAADSLKTSSWLVRYHDERVTFGNISQREGVHKKKGFLNKMRSHDMYTIASMV